MLKTNVLYNRNCVSFLPNEIPDKSVDLIFTDPPYDLNEGAKRFFQKEFLRVCKGAIVVFAPPENQWIQPADQYLFWNKPISTKNTSRRYSRFVEMIFVYNVETWNCHRHWSNYVNTFSDFVDSTDDHPHRKPFSLITRLLLNHSVRGDIVLDPFAGSGVVLEAAKLYGRKYIGVEFNRKYYYKAKRNLERKNG